MSTREEFERDRHVGPRSGDGYCLASDQEAWDDWQSGYAAGQRAGAAPSKDDCRMLDAIMKAAKQIHAEFDCLSDHVMTARQIREQISAIIWKHIETIRALPSPPERGEKKI